MKVRNFYQGTVLLLAGMFLAGCPSQEQIERDFQIRREAAYQRLMQSDPNDTATDLKIVKGGLSIADCIELALRNNKDVQTAKIKLLEAKGQMTGAIATALPQATFTGSALRNDNSGLFNQKETYELQVLARQPLYLGGITGAAIDAAAVFTYMTQQELRATIHAVELNIRSLYLNTLLAEELVRVAEQAKRDAEKLLKDTETMLKFGTATRFEVLRAEVRVSNVDAELIQIRNEYELFLTRLLREMGVSQLSKVHLVDTLQYEKIEKKATESLYAAMKQRPELLIGEAMIRLAKSRISSLRRLRGGSAMVTTCRRYRRSFRRVPASTSCSRGRRLEATILVLTASVFEVPSGVNVPSWSTASTAVSIRAAACFASLFWCFEPNQSSIMDPDNIEAIGLAIFLPAYLGALPWIGSNMAIVSPMLAPGPIPTLPTVAAAKSEMMSPNRFSATTTSKWDGVRTCHWVIASM